MTRQPDVRTTQTNPIGIRTARYDKGLADRPPSDACSPDSPTPTRSPTCSG